MPQIRIGCSGWSYKPWRGTFYPEKLPAKDWFAYYSSQFDTAEINATFYRLPSEAAVDSWARRTPPGFQWAWKASRYITHNKKLKDCADSLELVLGRMDPLGQEALILFQLPPSLHRNDERLAEFLALLPRHRRCAFEFRHPGWYDDDIFALLSRHNASLVISDHHHAPSPWVATADFVYVRGHGPGGRYAGHYSAEDLGRWAEHVAIWRDQGRDVFCYFDNDIGTAAPRDAKDLIARIGNLGTL